MVWACAVVSSVKCFTTNLLSVFCSVARAFRTRRVTWISMPSDQCCRVWATLLSEVNRTRSFFFSFSQAPLRDHDEWFERSQNIFFVTFDKNVKLDTKKINAIQICVYFFKRVNLNKTWRVNFRMIVISMVYVQSSIKYGFYETPTNRRCSYFNNWV